MWISREFFRGQLFFINVVSCDENVKGKTEGHGSSRDMKMLNQLTVLAPRGLNQCSHRERGSQCGVTWRVLNAEAEGLALTFNFAE